MPSVTTPCPPEDASSTLPNGAPIGQALPVGARVGRYQVLEAIGRGGMGEVYAAYHPDLDRRIALKIVYGARAAEPDRQARLLREARIIARLNHPNIVSVYDAGVVGEQVYVAMELVDGQTLEAWLRQENRRWLEILEVFEAAGRGLAAAHDAKVIHRDFKPQNVMIGRDGRVRVMDFGLARGVLEASDAPSPAGAAALPQMLTSTTVGALVGTPAYMAPEQLRGDPIDVRADQFSFCVALHEALYGTRPGVPAAQSRSGRTRRFPAWVKAIARRGLEHDRDKRFRAMGDLLRAMEHGRRHVRWLAALASIVAVLVLAVTVGARASKVPRFSCAAPLDRINSVWPAEELPNSRRASLHRLFRGHGVSGGEALWNRLSSLLDQRMGAWAAMYQQACEATHVRGEQSAEVLDLRMSCLADVLDETRAYTDALSTSSTGVERALSTAAALTPVQGCADVKNLRLEIPLPTDPQVRAEVEKVQQKLNDASVWESMLQPSRAAQALTEVVRAAQRLEYKPLLAQALQKLGMAESEEQHFVDGVSALRQALLAAEESRDDLTAARAADNLACAEVELNHLDMAAQWLALADAIVQRIGAQESITKAWILNDRANLDYARGDFVTAEVSEQAAVTLKTRLLGPLHPDVARSLDNLAFILAEQGRFDEGLAASAQAIAITERLGDRQDLVLANQWSNRAELLLGVGRLDECERMISRGLDIARPQGDNVILAVLLTDRGNLLLQQGRPQQAVAALTEAVEMQARINERDPIRLAVSSFTLARALTAVHRDQRRAVAMARGACLAFEERHFRRRQEEVISWWNALGNTRASTCADLPRPRGSRSAPPPVRQLQQDHVGRGAVAEGAR